jgi:hypothetical protein
MSLLAICSSMYCDFRLRLQDADRGVSIPTPSSCPRCDSFLLTYCPVCEFPLTVNLNPECRCEVCQCDLRRAFAQSRSPRWITEARQTRMSPRDWMTPSIRRTDTKTFYLVLADLPERRRLRTKKAPACLSAIFHFVREDEADKIESVTVLLTRPPHFFAVLESQLRIAANELAVRLTNGLSLSGEYRFDGRHIWPRCDLQ